MSTQIIEGLPPKNKTSIVFRATAAVVPAYIPAIAGAEAVGVFLGIIPGIICPALLIPMLLSQYVIMEKAPYRRVLPLLVLAPLLRILSLTMPIRQVPPMYWYALVGVPLLV